MDLLTFMELAYGTLAFIGVILMIATIVLVRKYK